MEIDRYHKVRDKHGLHSSWAIWAEETDTPKSNMADISFFDDESIVEQLSFKESLNSINFPKDENYNTLKTFSKMLNNKHFVIANSTFSYMAALLGAEEDSTVIMPKPWMKNMNYNLSLNSWIEINCKFELLACNFDIFLL